MSYRTGSICDISNNCHKIILDISNQLPIPYDYSHLGKVWGLGFSSVLSLWLVSYALGTIVRAVRNS